VTSDRSHRRDHYRGCFVATPTTADARWRGGWWGPALGGFALGALIGSAFPRPYYAYPYYGYGYGYPAYGYGYAAYSYGYPAYNYAYPAYYGDSPRPYYGSRERFLTELTLDPPNGTSGRAGAPLLDEDYTVLSTIHSAKGQEWRIVRILNVVDGCIPSDMATRTPEEIEEERRLLYVAMTRAKDELDLVVPHRVYTHQQARFGDGHVYASISRFIPSSIRNSFDCQHWRERPDRPAMAARKSGPTADVAASLLRMWR
jgi:UvrD-like helicase C-terminal domain